MPSLFLPLITAGVLLVLGLLPSAYQQQLPWPVPELYGPSTKACLSSPKAGHSTLSRAWCVSPSVLPISLLNGAGRGALGGIAASELCSDMVEKLDKTQAGHEANFVLHPHRSLSPRGFLILMSAVGAVSFLVGIAFAMIGAWPVMGFFGLDVALIYVAFKLNYRSGRVFETVRLTPQQLRLARHYPSGRIEAFDFNPYWARVRVTTDRPDGRTSLRLAAEGREISFGHFLTDDERRDFADELTSALIASRTASAF